MGVLSIELPPQQAQAAVLEQRWRDLLADPDFVRFEGRIETDRHGRVVMTPPPTPQHGSLQSEIAHLLRTLLPPGRVITECPVATADGVKAADVAWASAATMDALGDRVSFPRAPEVCVEVLSPGNTQAEMDEKTALYFDAGAAEVWLCSETGTMTFLASGGTTLSASRICPRFPAAVVLS